MYLVIGSNSFTGSHIVDALLEDPVNQVIGISRSPEYKDVFLPYAKRDNPNFTFIQLDIIRQFKDLQELLERIKPKIVINVAALSEVVLSHDIPQEYFSTNTLGVVGLCDHLRKTGFIHQYVHISSAEIFGSCDSPVDENTGFNPSTPYAVSKASADMYINTLIKNFDFPATIIRSTNVYGPHQQLFKIIPRTMIYLKLGGKIELHGGGKSVKSFVHIRDVVEGLMKTIKGTRFGTYHFSGVNKHSVAQIVENICKTMGQDFESSTIETDERLGQDDQYILSCAKSEIELGWKAKTPFSQGLNEVFEWIDNNWSVIQKENLTYIHKP